MVPNLRQRVEREIDQEIKTQQQSSKQSPHPFLEQFPDLSITPTTPKKDIYHDLLHISLPRLTNSTPTSGPDQTTGLDLDRLNIPYPADPTDLEAWEQAFSNAKAQLEQQRLRLLNLNLIGQYGPNHWKLSNFLIEKEIAKLELALEHATAEIDGVNRRRKANQVSPTPIPVEHAIEDRQPHVFTRWLVLWVNQLTLAPSLLFLRCSPATRLMLEIN